MTDTKNPIAETKDFSEIQPGCLVRVHEKIKETNSKGEEKERVQIFEGMVLDRKHGKGVTATVTVRKESDGIGVEKIYPLHSPAVEKFEVVKRFRVTRSKLTFLRGHHRKLQEIKK
jgi:large subunit ribosomal protein L19